MRSGPSGPSSRVLVASLLALAMTSGSIVVAPRALAEVSASEKETARNLMESGRDKRDAGDHKGALEAFMAADAIMHVTTTGVEVAHELEALGRLTEARDKFLEVARIPAEPKEPKPFTEARLEAEQAAEAIAPRIPTMTLAITGVPAGAALAVTIDGDVVPPATIAVPRKIDPGAHVIVAKAGAAEKRAEVTLKASETREVAIAFVAADFAGASADPNPSPTSNVVLDVPPRKTNALTWIGFGVAGVGVVVGSVTGLMSMSKTSSLKSSCTDGRCPPSTHSDYDTAKSLATISTVSFVVGALGAGVGIYGLLKGSSTESAKPAGDAKATGAGPTIDVFVTGSTAGVMGSF